MVIEPKIEDIIEAEFRKKIYITSEAICIEREL